MRISLTRDVKRESRCDIDAHERRLKDRRYRYAVITLYALVDNKRILGKSLDKGLAPLISHQDVLSLLKYVPRYKEIEVYVKKHMMEVVFGKGKGKGKGVVIKEIVEDDKTRYMNSTSKVDHPLWSTRSLSDSDISEHPESMNEKRNKRCSKEFQFRIQLFENDFAFGLDLSQYPIDMTKEVKAEQEMQEPVYYNFHPLMYDSDYDCSISGLEEDLETWNDDDDLLQQVYPYDWQQDPYDRDDETEENVELFAELDNLLEHLPFLNDELKENVVGVDAPVIVVEEQLERIEHVVDEEIKRPRKRKREGRRECICQCTSLWKDQQRGESIIQLNAKKAVRKFMVKGFTLSSDTTLFTRSRKKT
ncbi:hypothetical protein Tco_0458763 [Tanacetum coccineum]